MEEKEIINFDGLIKNQDNQKSNSKQAEELLETSQILIAQTKNEANRFKMGLIEAVQNFERIKGNFLNITLRKSKELLKQVGFVPSVEEGVNDAFELQLSHQTNDGNLLNITKMYSGHFTGVVLGIFFGILTILAWIFFTFTKFNIPLDETIVTNYRSYGETVLTWLGGGITGATGNPIFGMVIILLSAVMVGWMVYSIRIALKSTQNLRTAKEMYLQANAYARSQKNAQEDIIQIENHLKQSNEVIENLEVILEEKNATLRRIIHIEGILPENNNYHASSQKVMKEVDRVLLSINTLLNTSITSEGKVNPESQKVLGITQAIYAEYLSKMYI